MPATWWIQAFCQVLGHSWIEADRPLERVECVSAALVGRDRLLDQDRTSHRVHDALKVTERAVAREFDHTAAMLRKERLDHLLPVGFEALEGDALVSIHQA